MERDQEEWTIYGMHRIMITSMVIHWSIGHQYRLCLRYTTINGGSMNTVTSSVVKLYRPCTPIYHLYHPLHLFSQKLAIYTRFSVRLHSTHSPIRDYAISFPSLQLNQLWTKTRMDTSKCLMMLMQILGKSLTHGQLVKVTCGSCNGKDTVVGGKILGRRRRKARCAKIGGMLSRGGSFTLGKSTRIMLGVSHATILQQ